MALFGLQSVLGKVFNQAQYVGYDHENVPGKTMKINMNFVKLLRSKFRRFVNVQTK